MIGHAERLFRLLIVIMVLWLVGVASLIDSWVVGIVIALPGLAALALCVRQTLRTDFGAVAAWAACSLAPLGALCLIALSNVHLYEFTGTDSTFDCVVQGCGVDPVRGVIHTLSVSAFIVAGILTLRLIAVSNRDPERVEAERP